MPTICSSPLPQNALLNRYEQDGSYTDCYYIDVPHAISMSEYVATFYTTPLFRVERKILALFAGRPSTDADAKELAFGQSTRFAAWDVEERASNQLLLRDFLGQTRSWLMVTSIDPSTNSTRLYFGSAFVPKSRSASGQPSFGFLFHALSGFHRLYTKALMRAAQAKLTSVNWGVM